VKGGTVGVPLKSVIFSQSLWEGGGETGYSGVKKRGEKRNLISWGNSLDTFSMFYFVHSGGGGAHREEANGKGKKLAHLKGKGSYSLAMRKGKKSR